MSKAYFGSRISDHILKTPEGFLICKDVPIARTGMQQYRGCEFGAQDSNRIYDVNRPEAQVFDRAAIASFEGKPVCDEHPSEDVTPENYRRYMKGVCRDVRRGEGDLANCLVADLLIYDADLIQKIEGGKREISCGYDCLWNPTGDASFDQLEIRGNHVAVVDKGRAGHMVAIRDAANQNKGGRKMPNKNEGLWGRILRALARDESCTNEDMEAAAKLAGGADATPAPAPAPAPAAAPAPAPAPAPAKDEEAEARFQKIEAALADLSNKIGALVSHETHEHDPLGALEKELTKGPEAAPAPAPEGADDEGDVIEPPEEINANDGECGDGECAPAEMPKETRDAALALLQTLKPAVAAIKDEGARNRAADSLAILIKGSMEQDVQYSQLLDMRRKTATRDSAPEVSDEDLGRAIAQKYNPHYKNRK